MYFFTSDIHFGNSENLILENRPFKTVKAFDNFVIKMFNRQAKKDDIIYVIGDFVDCDGKGCDSWKKAIYNVNKINAKVVLVMGNNEDRIVDNFYDGDYDKFRNYCLSVGFYDVVKDTVVEINNKKFYLVHRPIYYKKEYINLFGHIHREGGIYRPYGFNVCLDLNNFMLYSTDDIETLLERKRIYWDKDKDLNM